MKSLKRVIAGLLLALLLVFTLNSKAEAVADFKACWTTGATDNILAVMYFSFTGEDTYSVNGKITDPGGVLYGAMSGTAVFGATEIVGSATDVKTFDSELIASLSIFTIDLATLNLTSESIDIIYNRTTTVIDTSYYSHVMIFTACP